MPHLADAVAELGSGSAIFDPISDRLETVEEFRQRLQDHPNQERIDHHLRMIWTLAEVGGVVETRGLRKIGLPELKTNPVPEDERSIVSSVVEELAARLWAGKEKLSPEHELELFGQAFSLRVVRRSLAEARIELGRIAPR
jgi:hypothetical protein